MISGRTATALAVGQAVLAALAARPAFAASPPQQAGLRDARIHIGISGDTARVSALYRVGDAPDTLRLNAIRIAGQRLAFHRPLAASRLRLDTLPGLLRLTAAARGRGLTLEVRYDVTGDLSRIPLFVPDVPTVPGDSRLVILVNGLPPARAARFPFPRFTRPAGATWASTPHHLPAFVALVAPSGGIPVPTVAQWSVLLIGLGGTGAWLVAQLRARRRS